MSEEGRTGGNPPPVQTWFPPTQPDPLPVTVLQAPPPGVDTWFPPSSTAPLPVAVVSGSTGGGIPEPPDSQLYGRRGPQGSGVWSLITTGTGVPEAPTTGGLFGRGQVAGVQSWGAVLPMSGGTLTGPLILAADPTAALGAATKEYVDAVGVTANAAVRRAGDTMTGMLTLAADPATGLQAATRQYVDNHTYPYVPLGGATMTGLLVLSGPPVATLGAATKAYVDAVGATANAAVMRAGDTMTGPLILSGDPTAALGTATKQYVDAVNTTALAAVRRAGDTMTGGLILNADPTVALGAVTKQYADNIMAAAEAAVDVSGDTMTGPLILSGDPTVPLGAATKQYVDAHAGGAPPAGAVGQAQYYATSTTFGGSSGLILSATAITAANMSIGATPGTGDLYYRAATGALTQLPIGTNGYTLQVLSGLPAWVNVATGGGTVGAGTAGQVALYTGANTVAGFTMSGNVTIGATGVTTIGALQVATGMLAANAVTYAKMQNVVNANRLLGNPTATAGQPVIEVALGTGLNFTGGTTLNNTGVTNVGFQVPAASIYAATGSPVTTTGTLGFSVTGTSGGIPYFSTAAAVSSSGALAQYGVVLGGGAGGAPTATAAGATGQVLTGVTGGAPTWQAPTGVTASTALVNNQLVLGTGASTVAPLAAGTSGYVLQSNGTGNAPSWVQPTSGGTVIASPQFDLAYYPTAGSVATVQGHAAMTVTAAGSLTINRNTTSGLPAASGTPGLWVNFADVDTPNILLDGHNSTAPVVLLRTAGGTTTLAPTAAGVGLGAMAWRGYEGTTPAYSAAAAARLAVSTLEAFTSTHQGVQFSFQANQLGTTNQMQEALLGPGLLVGAVGAPLGTGTIAATQGSALVNPGIAGTSVLVQGADGNPANIVDVAVGGNPNVALFRANYVTNATAANLTQVTNGQIVGRFGGGGYYGPQGTGGWAAIVGNIAFAATENWVDINHTGTNLTINTGPTGTGTTVAQAVFGPGLTVGSGASTPAAPTGGILLGDLNAMRVFANGVQITPGGLTASTALVNNQLVLGSGAATVAPLPAGTTGYVLQSGGTTGPPTWVQPTSGGTVVASPQFDLAYYPTAGSVATVQGHAAMTVTAAGSLTINRNAAALPVAQGNSGLWINYADSTTDTGPNILLDNHGIAPAFVMRTAGGTGAAPSATTPAIGLGAITMRGYYVTGGPAYTATAVTRVDFNALDTFTSTAQGTNILFSTTPQGSTGVVAQATIGPGLLVGSVGSPQGAGTITSVQGANLVNTTVGGIVLDIQGNDANPASTQLLAVGGNPNYTTMRANGTTVGGVANLTQVASGQIIGRFGAGGYYGGATPAFASIVSNIAFMSAEAWVGNANTGAYMVVNTSPLATGTTVAQAQFGPVGVNINGSGGALPTAPSGGMLQGDINVAGRIMINGTPLNPGFAESAGWLAGANPNNAIIFTNNSGRTLTVTQITGTVEIANSAAITVNVKAATSGTLVANGTTVNTTAFNNTLTPGTPQVLFNGSYSLATNARLGLAAGTGTWDNAVGVITVYMQ